MRVASVACLFFFPTLSGCIMPRPWLAPTAAETCSTVHQPLDGKILVASFRSSDCHTGRLRWTPYRSEAGEFSAVDEKGQTTFNSRDVWLKELKRRAPTVETAPVVYIHGFDNGEDFAVERADAIRVLLCDEHSAKLNPSSCTPRRPVVAVTWPSFNRLVKYTWDEANNEWAQGPAVALIVEIAREMPGTILVAHSMGNRILIPAAMEASRERASLDGLILASPDVDRESVAELLRRPGGLGFPATIYASLKDQALSLSWRTHGNPRAGDLSYWVSGRVRAYPYDVLNNAEVVDTTSLSDGVAAHAAFIETLQGAADLCHVLAGELPVRDPDPAHPHYWALRDNSLAGDSCEQRAIAAVQIASRNPAEHRKR